MSLKYYLPEHGETIEDARNFKDGYPLKENTTEDADDYACEAAEYHHDNEDGWESSWPLIFAVMSEDGTEERFSIDRESRPHFYVDKRAPTIEPHTPEVSNEQ